MKKPIVLFVSLVFLLLAGTLFTECARSPSPVAAIRSSLLDRNMAANSPDRFAWELFVRLFQAKDGDIKNGTIWENWISTTTVYKNPCGPAPIWPKSKERLFPKPRKFQTFFESLNKSGKVFHPSGLTMLTLSADNPYMEEVRINKPMFDYITANELYNKTVVYEQAVQDAIEFPQDAIVMKVQWKKIGVKDLKDFYWRELMQEDQDGKLFKDTVGLAGFHIVSKELPNWVWTTFEHVKNPGRCDYIGCEDEFGAIPQYIEPRKVVVQTQYKPAEMTSELAALFEEYNVPDIFKNYQLRGTQTEYTDQRGNRQFWVILCWKIIWCQHLLVLLATPCQRSMEAVALF